MQTIRYILLLIFSTLLLSVSAQDTERYTSVHDSLAVLLSHTESDSAKIPIYKEILRYNGIRDTVLHYASAYFTTSERLGDTLNMVEALLQFAYIHFIYSEYKDCENNLALSLRLAKKGGLEKQMARAYYFYSVCCEAQDNIAGLLDYGNQALNIYRQLADTGRVVNIYLIFAQSCGIMSMYQTAYDYLVRAMTLSFNSGDYDLTSDALTFYAYYMFKQFNNRFYSEDVRICKFDRIICYCNRAIGHYEKADILSYYRQQLLMSNYLIKASAYLQKAQILNSKSFVDSCEVYFKKSRSLPVDDETLKQESILLQCELFYVKKEYRRAIDTLLELEKNTQLNRHTAPILKNTCKLLAICYSSLNNDAKNLEYIEKTAAYQRVVIREAANKQYADFKIKTMSQRQIDLLESTHTMDIIRKVAEIKRQNYLVTFLLFTLLMIVLVTVIIINLLKRRKRVNNELKVKNDEISQLNTQIVRQKDEIEQRRDIITMQFDMVESFNESITSNIKYASKIQRAALPSIEEVRRVFADSFVLYRPKDIVSGDFYTVGHKGNLKIFIAADCTGHGVPGALLSMLGVSAVNDALCNIQDVESFSPAQTLDSIREFIIKVFDGNHGLDIYDGMDMSICAFYSDSKLLKFASANQSAFVWRDGKIIRIKGDKMPVGRYVKESGSFTLHTMQLQKDDMVYMATDGIQDQLGGKDSKKFLIRSLIVLLEKIGNLPSEEQPGLIIEAIDQWRGHINQIDDITVTGFRV